MKKFCTSDKMAVRKPTKKIGEDYSTFGGIVIRESEMFKLKELTSDMFRCLVFVQGLTTLVDGRFEPEFGSN